MMELISPANVFNIALTTKGLSTKALIGLLTLVFALFSHATTEPSIPLKPGDKGVLNFPVNFRSAADFSRPTNIISSLTPPTTIRVIRTIPLKHPNGETSPNLGVEVQIIPDPSAPERTGRIGWIHYNPRQPSIRPAAQAINVNSQPRLPQLGQAAVPPQTPQLTRRTVEVAPSSGGTGGRQQTEATVCPGGRCEHQQTRESIDSYARNILQATVPQERAEKLGANHGARLVMAAIYQSCDVLEMPLYDPSTQHDIGRIVGRDGLRRLPLAQVNNLLERHYYLQPARSGRLNGQTCKDPRIHPPVFNFGRRPTFPDQNTIRVRNPSPGGNGFSSTTGLDCTAFVSIALSAAGLKITPQIQRADQNLTHTAQMINFGSQNSCFERPRISAQNQLQAGDILAWNEPRSRHALIIDEVGDDPFGVFKLQDPGTIEGRISLCRGQPRRENFNFTIIQSASFGSLPAMRIHAKHYTHDSTNGISRWQPYFEQACLSRFNLIRTSPPRQSRVALLRHRGSDECRFSAGNHPKLEESSCIGDCGQGRGRVVPSHQRLTRQNQRMATH